jgi:hypothetical protein
MVVNLGSTASSFGIEVVNPDGGRSARFTFTTNAPPPSVSSISPSSPPVVNDNQNVGVNGSSFQSGLTVDVFNSSGTKISTLSGSQILNVTPTSFTMVANLGSTASTFGIEVVNPNGGRSTRFTFSTQATAPTVSSISPNPVPTFNANQNVQVFGSNFQTSLTVDVFNNSGTKIATLSGSQILNVTATSFTMVINLGSSASSFGIEVVNPDGGSSARFTFTTNAPPPSVSSISPSSPPVINGNQNVGVNGSSFQSGLTVDVFNSGGTKIGTLSGTQILNVTPTSFTMVINLGSTVGTFGIEVGNPNGGRSTRFNFSTQATNPTVSSINPNPVPTFNANQNVQVNGTNFQTNLTVDVFNSGGTKISTLSGSQILNVTATSFTMVVNLGSTASTFGIEVVNPDGGRSTRFTFSTTAPNPVVSSISPNPVPVVNANQNAAVNGSNFQSGLTVDVFNSSGTKISTLSGSQILNVTPTSFTMLVNLGSTASTFGIEVVNPNGGRSSRFTFSTQATPPTISSISPNPVPTFNANQNVQVNGTSFQTNLTVDVFNGGGTKIATLSGSQILNVTATSFTMVVNLGSTASTFGIEVVNPDGGRSTRFTFSTTAPNPVVNSISPNPVPVFNGNQNVQVFGSSFQFNLTVDVFNSSGTKISTLSGSQILNVTPTSFTMVVNLGSTASSFGIEVVNPNGGRSSRFTFSTVSPNPSVSSISPNPVPTFNANQNVQVFGSNFQTNLTVDVFNSGGTKIATLSGSQILNVTATSFTMVANFGSTASTFGIEVVNPDGGRSTRFTFSTTALNPVVSSISPNPVPVFNGNQNVQVFGSNFQFNLTVDVFNSSGTKIGTLSGTQILNVTATSFTMVVNLGGTAGTFGIEVVNPNGGRSSRFTFSY